MRLAFHFRNSIISIETGKIMISPFYKYGVIKTQKVEDSFPTQLVENFLCLYEGALSEGAGRYVLFGSISIQVMFVKSFDSWSEKDYDPLFANYISFVFPTKNQDMYKNKKINKLIARLEECLGLPFELEEE